MKNRNPKTNLRILLLPSVCQTEFDSNASRVIYRLALAQSRLEFDLLCRLRCGLIESVTKSADHTVDLNVAVGQEDHFQHNVAFQLHATPFGAVLRPRLVQDSNRVICRAIIAAFFLWRRHCCDRFITESAGLNRAAFAASNIGCSSGAFASTRSIFGCSALGVMKMWGCFGERTGSTTGVGGGVFTFAIFGGAGGGATGISVIGCAIST